MMAIDFKKARLIFLTFLVVCFFTIMENAQAQSAVTCDASQAQDPNPNPYMNIYMDPGVIFNHTQLLALPAGAGVGVVYAGNTKMGRALTPCPNAPWKDPVLTYAAYLYCDYASEAGADPMFNIPAGQSPTLTQLREYQKYIQVKQVAQTVREFCYHLIQKRIAYPDPGQVAGYNNTAVLNGSPDPNNGCPADATTAFCVQKQQCHLLKDPMQGAQNAAANVAADSTLGNANTGDGGDISQGGSAGGPGGIGAPGGVWGAANISGVSNMSVGIVQTGEYETDQALQDCDEFGFSLEAGDYMLAHACNDMNSVGVQAGNVSNHAELEKEGLEGCAAARDHDRGVEEDRAHLASLVLQLAQVKAEMAIARTTADK